MICKWDLAADWGRRRVVMLVKHPTTQCLAMYRIIDIFQRFDKVISGIVDVQ
jgi:hypothetical protein